MAQGWFKRNFGWIATDFRSMVHQLKQLETWVVIGIMCLFGLIIYYGYQLAKKTDSLLRFINNQTSLCRELTNGPIIFLFSATFFFALCATLTFGELTQYFEFKRHNAYVQTRRALLLASFWGLGAIALASALILFLNDLCQ